MHYGKTILNTAAAALMLSFSAAYLSAGEENQDSAQSENPEPGIPDKAGSDRPKEYMPPRTDSVAVIKIRYPRAVDLAQTLRNLYPDKVVWIRPLSDSGDARARIERALNRMEALTDASTLSVSNRNTKANTVIMDGDGDYSGNYQEQDSNRENAKTSGRQVYRDTESFSRRERDEKEVRGLYLGANPSELVFLSSLPGANMLVVRAGAKETLEEFKTLIESLDKPVPQVLLEVRVLRVDISDLQGWGLDLSLAFDNFSFATAPGSPKLPSTLDNIFTFPQDVGDLNANMKFDGANVTMNVNAASVLERVTELTTPTLLVADNEASRLFIGTESTVLQKASKGAIIVGGTSTTTSSTWTVDAPRRNIGTSLVITPEIHADRTVTVRINYEKSDLGGERVYKFPETWENQAPTPETVSVKGFQFTSYDINSSMIATSVVARDGGLIALGGLISEGVVKYSDGIPGLMDIPILGELIFSKVQERRARYETVILIRPYIISVPEEGQEKRINDFLFSLSQHPSASAELPTLKATLPEDVAKSRSASEDTPWYMHPITSWLFSWKVTTDEKAETPKAIETPKADSTATAEEVK